MNGIGQLGFGRLETLMDFKALGAKIRTERKNMRLTQEQLAERVGVSTNFIGQIERGERKLSLETLVALANALGTGVDYLLSGSLTISDDRIAREILTDLSGLSKERKLLLRDFISRFKNI